MMLLAQLACAAVVGCILVWWLTETAR